MNDRHGPEASGASIPGNRVQRVLKSLYQRLIRIRGKPTEIARGFALGVFVGMSPFIGFHTALAIFIASLLKWNKIASAIGVWISNPATAPILYSLTYYVGTRLLGKSGTLSFPLGIDVPAFLTTLAGVPEILWSMVLGGVVLGLPLALAAYYFVLSAVRKYQEEIREKLIRQKALRARKREHRRKKRNRVENP